MPSTTKNRRRNPNMDAANDGSSTAVADPPAEEQVPPPVDEPEDPDDDQDAGDGEEGEDGQTRAIANREAAPFGTLNLTLGGVHLKATSVSIELPASITVKKYGSVWAAVDNLRDRSKWWQGELLNFGEQRWPDRYTQAIEATGSAYQSLLNVASICRKWPVAERHPGVSFSHHAVLSPMPSEPRAALLQRAYEEGLTVEQLRNEYREWKAEQEAAKNGQGKAPDLVPVRADGIGVQPVNEEELPDDDPGWECPSATCEGQVFAVAIAHCMDCGAHYATEGEDGEPIAHCPYCPGSTRGSGSSDDDDDLGDGAAAPPSSGAVSGLVIPGEATLTATPDSVLQVVGVTEFDVADAVAMYGVTADALPKLMSLHHWLGQVIEGLAGEEQGERVKTIAAKPEAPATVVKDKPMPAPKPGGKGKGKRAPRGSDPEPKPEPSADDDGLPFD